MISRAVPDQRPGRDGEDHQAALARRWGLVASATTYVPMSARELDDFLIALVRTLTEALAGTPFSPAPGAEVGARMVAGQLVGIDTLARSVELLVDALLSDADSDEQRRNVVALLSALSAGYADALRRRTLDQQEDMKRALLSAKQRAEQVMQATEQRFRKIFTASPVGIAITSLDGRFLETNPALAGILACRPEDLAGRSLAGFFAENTQGPMESLRGRRKLVRGDGEAAWVYVAMSPLRDGPGEPNSYVTTVQDLSELQLLQGRFGHQLLHDALTGLANRLRFESALETRLGQAAPDATITLYRLNLDAFSVINDGLGHEAGDRLLKTVANRLEEVFVAEKALVARTGGDEFAILVEDAPDTPDIPRFVALINEALAEPEYIDGSGIAVGATIGAARGVASRITGAELFRSAEAAVRAAASAGRRQWMGFDQQYDQRERRAHRDAAALPGAFESGELAMRYRPVVRLADRCTVAYHGMLAWPGRADGPLGAHETMALAESAGHSVLFGPWVLRQACQDLATWRPLVVPSDSVLRLRLTRLQTADDDLVAAVVRAMGAGEVAPGLLEVAFDTGAVLEDYGAARDNLEVVADIGVRTALCRFHGGPRELALVDAVSVRSVILADPFDGDPRRDSVVGRATASLVAALTELGVAVSVDGVRTGEEADWWARTGVDTAQGPLFGVPADLQDILTGNGRGD